MAPISYTTSAKKERYSPRLFNDSATQADPIPVEHSGLAGCHRALGRPEKEPGPPTFDLHANLLKGVAVPKPDEGVEG